MGGVGRIASLTSYILYVIQIMVPVCYFSLLMLQILRCIFVLFQIVFSVMKISGFAVYSLHLQQTSLAKWIGRPKEM